MGGKAKLKKSAKKVVKKVADKAVPVKADRKQVRREQKQAQSMLEVKKQLREKSVLELKGDIADFYSTVEQAEGMERQAKAMEQQAANMKAGAMQNIGVRREIIAEKG